MRQVTAETWPFLQMDHGNIYEGTDTPGLYVSVSNAGVGPARVKSFKAFHNKREIESFDRFLFECCKPEGMEQPEYIALQRRDSVRTITDNISPIIPDGDKVYLFQFAYDSAWPSDSIWPGVWKRFDKVRWGITAEACYCSLLGDCYQSNLRDDPVEVKACYSEDVIKP